MRYLGGKVRFGKRISNILKQYREPKQIYLEPFVGAGSVFENMRNPRIGSDLDEDIISFLVGLRDGWIPPSHISEETYNKIKNGMNVSPALRGFVAYGCSYGGKKWGGYARGEGRDFSNEAYRNALRQASKLIGAIFIKTDYTNWFPQNMLIYCDPPYKNVEGYSHLPAFDHKKFWDIMRSWSENNTVLISEYSAPRDFVKIWSAKKTTTIDQKSIVKNTECLFIRKK